MTNKEEISEKIVDLETKVPKSTRGRKKKVSTEQKILPETQTLLETNISGENTNNIKIQDIIESENEFFGGIKVEKTEDKYIMYLVVAIFVDKIGKLFARTEYFLSEWGAHDKIKFFKENIDTLQVIKSFGLKEDGEIELLEAWQIEKKKSIFEDMTVSNPKSLYIPLGGFVYIVTDDEKTTGWYKKDYVNGTTKYMIERNYDKTALFTLSCAIVEDNTKDENKKYPYISYIANIEDEGTLFNSFTDISKKFPPVA